MGDVTLRQALDEYKEIYMASRNFAERTRVEYFNDLEDLIQFLEKLGLKAVRDIELPHIERYLAELDHRGLAGSTRKRKVVSIRSFLSYLYHNQYMNTNLASRVIPPFAEVKSPRYLTKSEYERLLEAASHNPRDYALIQLLLQTGIKLSELTRLTVNNVVLPSVMSPEASEIGYLQILGTKSKKGRTVPLNAKACISLVSYFKGRKMVPNSALFTNRFGENLSPRGAEKIVNKYMHRAGIRDASVQSLRHTFGIQHILSGAKLKVIQEVMGHRDSRTTSLYLSLVKDTIGREIQEHTL
jgi:site-specific recombinase XerD